MPCIPSTYEVLTKRVSIAKGQTYPVTTVTHTLTAPAGKKPVSGGFDMVDINYGRSTLVASYPTGQDWTFKFICDDYKVQTVDLYLVCADV